MRTDNKLNPHVAPSLGIKPTNPTLVFHDLGRKSEIFSQDEDRIVSQIFFLLKMNSSLVFGCFNDHIPPRKYGCYP